MYIPFLQLLTNSITVIESQPSVEVKFTTDVPPHIHCGCQPGQSENCGLRIFAAITTGSRPLSCGRRTGVNIAQAVVQWSGRQNGGAFCGMPITGNWKQERSLLIKAKVDGRLDGNERVQLKLTTQCFNGNQVTNGLKIYSVCLLYTSPSPRD